MMAAMRPSAHRGSLLSVVVPCLDEEAVVAETYAQLRTAIGRIEAIDLEIVFVDDGSQDGTLALLRDIQRNDSGVRVIALSRNFGHQIAVSAGLAESRGDAVVVIDADLQDPPNVIVEMVDRWRDGVDVAYGVRSERSGETIFKRWTAKAFYRLIAKISDVDIPLDAGDFRLMDRNVVDAVLAMPERDRLLRGMAAWAGFRQEAVYYHRDARYAGETKYPLRGMFRLAVDGMVSFSVLPLRMAIWLGFLAAAVSFLGIGYAFVVRLFTDTWVTGWTALIIAVLFMGGVQLVLIGVLGEYVGRVYGEVKRRPLYFVKERLGFPPSEGE